MEYSRRFLPHVKIAGVPVFVTYRLHGSLPAGRVFPDAACSGKVFATMDRLLDMRRGGPQYLRMPEVAGIAADAVQGGAGRMYALHAWVIMPNHVHLLMTPVGDLSEVLRRLKGATARRANLVLNRTGEPFWQQESYDRVVRNAEEFGRIGRYILANPVRAGLARAAEEYRWCSAFSGGAGDG